MSYVLEATNRMPSFAVCINTGYFYGIGFEAVGEDQILTVISAKK